MRERDRERERERMRDKERFGGVLSRDSEHGEETQFGHPPEKQNCLNRKYYVNYFILR